MDPSKEVSASEKERKPAGEESEWPSSKLLRTSTRILTMSEEECRDLEAEISSLKVKLEVLKSEANRDEQSAKLPRTLSGRLTLYEKRRLETEISRLEEKLRFMKIILDVAVLLLTTLEELNGEQLKTFQSKLIDIQLLGFPPIPESQLENADRRVTVDHMVKTYGPERAVEITLRILRGMDQNYLAKNLKRDYNRALLLTTLEELTGEQLKTFQSNLTSGLLPGFPPIPESQLENADRQVTVDQMVKTYAPERALEITLTILRWMNQNDLAEKLDYRHRRDADSDEFIRLRRKWHGALVMKEEAASEMERKPAGEESGELPSTSSGMLTLYEEKCHRLEAQISSLKKKLKVLNSEANRDEQFAKLPRTFYGRLTLYEEECRDLEAEISRLEEKLRFMKRSPENFEPEIYDCEGKGAYRFQCSSAGLFQCSITGLVFRMEGEGEVLYRTVPWDRRLLAQSGKRPAGPLFNIDCPLKSVCQLHLPHCQIHSEGGCDFLSVAHVTDDDKVEFIHPLEITDTHVIINITGFSAYGDVMDDDAPISPIHGLVLLFHQLFVPEERSILNVLLLPRNVVIREVQDERKSRNGDKETFIETNPHCNLTPNKPYILSTNITHRYRINPTTAKFVDFQSDENYFPTFQLFLETVVKEFDLLLKENGSTENVWNGLVWLPAPVQVQPHGPVVPLPAAPVQVQHPGPAAPTAVVRPSVHEDRIDLR